MTGQSCRLADRNRRSLLGRRVAVLGAACGLALLASSGPALAQVAATGTLNNAAAGTFDWSTLAWSPAIPGSTVGDTATLNAVTSTQAASITFTNDLTLKSFTLTTSGGKNVVVGSDRKTLTLDSGEAAVPATMLLTRSGTLDALSLRVDANLVLTSDLDAVWGRVQNREQGLTGVISGPGKLSVDYARDNLNGAGHIFRFGSDAAGTPTAANTHTGGTDLTSRGSGTNTTAFATAQFRTFKANAFGTGRLSLDRAAVNLNGFDQIVGGLTGGTRGSQISDLATAAGTTQLTLNFLSSQGPYTYTGTIGDTGSRLLQLVKSGTGTQTLAGPLTYRGGTRLAGGVLRIGAADVLPDTGDVVFAGGTLSTGATAGFSDLLGAMRVESSSTIALASGSHTLTFSAMSLDSTAPLSITGWTGSAAGGAEGRVVFAINDADPNTTYAALLSQISFDGFGSGAAFIGSPGGYELVPVPEPVSGSALVLGAATLLGRRRRRYRAFP